MLLFLVDTTIFSFFQTPLTNEGCGTQRLCASEPASCNPATGSCTLLGAKQKSGNDFEFILAGESSGYLAAVLAFGTTLVRWLHLLTHPAVVPVHHAVRQGSTGGVCHHLHKQCLCAAFICHREQATPPTFVLTTTAALRSVEGL